MLSHVVTSQPIQPHTVTTLHVTVVNGSYKLNSKTARLIEAIAQSLSEQCVNEKAKLVVRVVNLAEIVADLSEQLLSHADEQGPSDELQDAISSVTNADLLIAASPIYKASYTGLLKMFFDLLGQNSLREKAVLVCASGGSDEHRLALDSELRMLFSFFCAQVLPIGVYARAADYLGDGSLAPELTASIAQAGESAYRCVARSQ